MTSCNKLGMCGPPSLSPSLCLFLYLFSLLSASITPSRTCFTKHLSFSHPAPLPSDPLLDGPQLGLELPISPAGPLLQLPQLAGQVSLLLLDLPVPLRVGQLRRPRPLLLPIFQKSKHEKPRGATTERTSEKKPSAAAGLYRVGELASNSKERAGNYYHRRSRRHLKSKPSHPPASLPTSSRGVG